LAGSATKDVTKLGLASARKQVVERSQLCKLQICLQTTSTVSEVSRCRSPLRYLPSSLLRRTLRRWDVEQSPFTVVEMDLCGRRPPLLSKAPRISL